MPFRSDDEQIREQLRRGQETAALLVEERDDLCRKARAHVLQRRLTIGLVGLVLFAPLFGFVFGHVSSTRVAASDHEYRKVSNAGTLATQQASIDECTNAQSPMRKEKAACQINLDEARRLAFVRDVNNSACHCKRTDPFCTCWNDPPFNGAAAKAALARVGKPAEECFVPMKTLSIDAHVTFSLDGRVEFVTVEALGAWTLNAVETECLQAMIRYRVHAPPYKGTRVMMEQMFDLGRP